MRLALYGEVACCKYGVAGPATVAPHFQGLPAQAPSPSFTEGTDAAFRVESYKNKFAMIAIFEPRDRLIPGSGSTASPSDDSSIQALVTSR
jgi:hypothetical protein